MTASDREPPDLMHSASNAAMEIQLHESLKREAVGALASGIAHELNTPIQFIGDNVRFFEKSFAALFTLVAAYQLLGRECADTTTPGIVQAMHAVQEAEEEADLAFLSEDVPESIAHTLEGVESVSRIVRAMREVSHPSSDEKQFADINHALETSAIVAQNELKYAADVVMDLDPSLPHVQCDLSSLNQVFLNLMVNAAHAIEDTQTGAAGERGRITVRTRHEGDDVRISIQDTGTGIPDQIQGKIMEPFFTTKDVGKGTGQGLAIASIVVEKHHGSLSFETAMGRGTTFFIRIPILSEA